MLKDEAIAILNSLSDLEIEIFLCRQRRHLTNRQIVSWCGVSLSKVEKTFRKIKFLQERDDIIAAFQELFIHF